MEKTRKEKRKMSTHTIAALSPELLLAFDLDSSEREIRIEATRTVSRMIREYLDKVGNPQPVAVVRDFLMSRLPISEAVADAAVLRAQGLRELSGYAIVGSLAARN